MYEDEACSLFRAALVNTDRLEAVLFLQPESEAPAWAIVGEAWRSPKLTSSARNMLLSGRSQEGVVDHGPTICACFGVPQAIIEAAIEAGDDTPETIGRRLKAGTNCGSCIPELKRLIASCSPARTKERSGMMQTA